MSKIVSATYDLTEGEISSCFELENTSYVIHTPRDGWDYAGPINIGEEVKIHARSFIREGVTSFYFHEKAFEEESIGIYTKLLNKTQRDLPNLLPFSLERIVYSAKDKELLPDLYATLANISGIINAQNQMVGLAITMANMDEDSSTANYIMSACGIHARISNGYFVN